MSVTPPTRPVAAAAAEAMIRSTGIEASSHEAAASLTTTKATQAIAQEQIQTTTPLAEALAGGGARGDSLSATEHNQANREGGGAQAASSTISLEQFNQLGLSVSQIVEAKKNKKARDLAYAMKLNVGTALLQEHQRLHNKPLYSSSAKLTANHTPEELQGNLALTVIGFPRRQIGSGMSDCLVTGVQVRSSITSEKDASTVFVRPTNPNVPPGTCVSLLGEERFIESNPRDLNWSIFFVSDLAIATIERILQVTPREEFQDMKVQLEYGTQDASDKQIGALRVVQDYPTDSLPGQQVLVLKNLSPNEIQQHFGNDVTAVVCTVAGRSLLEPAKAVPNNYRLA